jgi:hypothetical protein
MAQNRFLNSLETVWDTLDLLATTTQARLMTACLKRVIATAFDQRADVGINHPGHPMYMYARQGIDTNRSALLETVRSRLSATETADETIQNALRALFEEEEAESYIRMTQALRRFRAWRTVLMEDSESE